MAGGGEQNVRTRGKLVEMWHRGPEGRGIETGGEKNTLVAISTAPNPRRAPEVAAACSAIATGATG